MSEIHWAVEHAVAGADHPRYQQSGVDRLPRAGWAWIVRPDRWSEIYPSAHRVRHFAGP
jgi:hypothetical protein